MNPRLRALVRRAASRSALHAIAGGAAALVSGQSVAGVLSVLGTILTARALGPQQFGEFALITAYALIITRLFAFQSLKVLVPLSSHEIASGNHYARLNLLGAAIILDSSGAAIAMAFALLLVPIAAIVWQLSSNLSLSLVVVSIGILTSGTSFSVAQLRMQNRYRTLAVHSAVVSAIRCAGVVIVMLYSPTVLSFIVWTTMVTAGGNLFLSALGLLTLSPAERRLLNVSSSWHTIRVRSGLLRNFVIANLDSTMRAVRDTDIPLLGLLAGTVEVGVYKVARQIASMMQVAVDQVSYVVFPELARLAATENIGGIRILILQSSFWIGILGLIITTTFALVGHPLISLAFGASFEDAYASGALCLLGVAIYGASQSLGPTLQAIGQFGLFARLHAVVTFLYLASVVGLGHALGALGASLALVLLHSCWAVLALFHVVRELSANERL